MRWILVEATERVCPRSTRSSRLRPARAARARHRGPAGTTIDAVTGESTKLSTGETVPTETVVWTAGVVPNPSLRHLSVPLDERGG